MEQTEKISGNFEPDAIDLKIMSLLRADAKLSSKELAAAVGLSLTPTYERVRRLERQGYILGYHASLSREKTGRKLRVLCQVSVKTHHHSVLREFEEEVIRLREVFTCFHIAGNYDYMLAIEVADMEAYSTFLKDKLARIPHIDNVQSSFVMAVLKEEP